MQFVLSLDFGSAYTKVALRRDPDKTSEILSDEAFGGDLVLNICIPSVVGAEHKGEKVRWLCGAQVGPGPSREGFTVYRNWKPQFLPVEQARILGCTIQEPSQGEVAAMTESEAVVASAARAVPSDGKVGTALNTLTRLARERQQLIREAARLQHLPLKEVTAVVDAEELTVADLRELVGRLHRSDSQPKGCTTPQEHRVEQVALEYFKGLRSLVQGCCQKKFGITDIGQVPVRVCVPAFIQPMSSVGGSRTCERLLSILREAGWKPDEYYPTITEPFANSIGILTEGRNKTWKNGRNNIRDLHMPSMLGDGPLLSAIEAGGAEHTVLLVDVGGYTSDFAVLQFNVKDYEDRPQILDYSEPLGVEDLDREVQGVLPPEKAAKLETLNFKNRLTFKEIVYDKMKPCFIGKGMKVGEGQEGDRIRDCIRTFAARVAHRMDGFLARNDVSNLHQIVFTGGGNNIPLIRSTLRDRLCKRAGANVAAVHLPLPPSEPSIAGVHRLDQQLVRGGSALGGASVYIDYMV